MKVNAVMQAFEGFQTHRIPVDDQVNLFVREAGQGTPIVLLHGWPQHGLMWHAVAPPSTQHFRVIIPDLRGAGHSSIPRSGYDKRTMAWDVGAILDALDIHRANIVGYDLGAGVAFSFAAQSRDRAMRLVVIEFGLPGFGYETVMKATPDWHNGSNWHLAFFTVPDVAEFAFQGKERELLHWFFWHLAHDPSAIHPDHIEAYVQQISKPGALRAGIEYYAAVWQDAEDNKHLAETPLDIPILAIGGAASSGSHVERLFQPVGTHVTGAVVPQAGHWIADENPEALSQLLIDFLGR